MKDEAKEINTIKIAAIRVAGKTKLIVLSIFNYTKTLSISIVASLPIVWTFVPIGGELIARISSVTF